MNTKNILITGAGFVVGLGEALIYFNQGQATEGHKKFNFKMPPPGAFVKLAATVLVTSIITTLLFKGMEMGLEAWNASKKEDEKQLA